MYCFPELNIDFPELVDSEGRGWIYRHVHNIILFVRANLKFTSAYAQKHWAALASDLNTTWRNKGVQFQIPIFSSADHAWLLSFDAILANKPTESDRVVLPVTNFDAYFGATGFSRK